jgi:hypothetical protein
MRKSTAITCAFLDIGGVLLTDGWDHLARRCAAKNFNLDLAEMEDRHHLTFEIFEEGKITLEEYLSLVVFHQKRTFTRNQFRRYMFEQSKAFPGRIQAPSATRLIAFGVDQYFLKSKAPSGRKSSAGAFQPSDFLGRALRLAAMSSSCCCE